MAEPVKRYSPLVSVGILFIVLGFLGPAATIKYAAMTSSATLQMLFPILTDTLRVGFFLGIAILLIGICRTLGVRGFGSAPKDGEQTGRVGVSKTGVASVLIGMVAVLMIGGAMGISAWYMASHHGSTDSSIFLVAGVMLISGLVLAVAGGILGLIGTAQTKKKNGFGITGLLLNIFIFLGLIVAVYMGSKR